METKTDNGAGTSKLSLKIPQHESLGLAVFNCGREECRPGYSWGPAMRDHYLFHYVLEGRGSFFNGNNTYSLSKGDGFLICPSQMVSYRADEKNPWTYSWVGFNGADAERLVSLTGISKEKPIFHYDHDDKLESLLRAIVEHNGPRACDEARMTAALFDFLAELMERFGGNVSVHKSGYEYVKKSIQFIDRNYSRPIDIDDIASFAGISRSHLYRLFMQHISMPPNEYLTRYRINKAAMLLRCHDLSVGEAAFSTGFSDQLYFSRVFKKIKGVPPSRYLRELKENQTAVPFAAKKEEP